MEYARLLILLTMTARSGLPCIQLPPRSAVLARPNGVRIGLPGPGDLGDVRCLLASQPVGNYGVAQ